MFIDLIVGARPNFVKIASVIKEIKISNKINKKINYRLIHTGQHYSKKLSNDLFEELNIDKPDFNLNVGSGSQANQTARIMVKYEKLLLKSLPILCLVVGDVNSTMACAIVAKKMNILVAHVEGGLRSFDESMPEEINRMVTDSIADFYFTTSLNASNNLLISGKKKKQIFFVGNTMIDTLVENYSRLKKPKIWKNFRLKNNNYFLLTLHRPSNVENQKKLISILQHICSACMNNKVIFPIHPRTKNKLIGNSILPKNLCIISPQSYLNFIYLLDHSKAILTDSGGVTEEATFLNIPCITFRNTTERPETISLGTNELIGDKFNKLNTFIKKINQFRWKQAKIPSKWDGNSSKRIVKKLLEIINKYENNK